MPHDAPVDKRKLLEHHPLFGRLEPDELDRLVTYMRVARYPRRTVLFRKGDPGNNMMVVVHGRVKVCTHSEDGKELVLNLFSPGEVFGEIALLDGADRTADAVTLDACELLVLERRDFLPFLRGHPDACMRLLAVLCQKLRQTSVLLEEALFLEGPSRLAKRLVHLAEAFGKPVADGVRIDLQLSQQQLGNMVGMSRESMNKHLRQWREDDLIRVQEGYYVITDLAALQAM
jgi:CRP/FNR family cyclic AMP-dependent transcriptional regulator